MDLRKFLDNLQRDDFLVTINQEVDWRLEAGALGRKSMLLQGPAPLFEKIRDYPEGFRIFSAPNFTLRRTAEERRTARNPAEKPETERNWLPAKYDF